MTAKPAVIGKISNLSISFRQQLVLSDINLELYKNRIQLLSGPSGSGKTTLLRALNRLNDCFEGCQTQGQIKLLLNGRHQQINSLKPQQLPALRKSVGMVFQHPQLLPGSIQDNVLLPLKVVNQLTPQAAQEKLRQATEQAALWEEIKDRLNQPAASLSGGQQQRLCLARTLALEPEILLLDEPTASLDKSAAAQIEDCITHLAKDYSIIMVSHSQSQADRLADYIIPINQGRLS